MIKIFNIILNGVDAEKYASKSIDEKKEFIIKHTNQRNEKLIDAFLQKPLKNATGCLNCGELNNKIENPFKNVDISKGISKAFENSNEPIVVAGSDEGNNIVRSKKPKRRKAQ